MCTCVASFPGIEKSTFAAVFELRGVFIERDHPIMTTALATYVWKLSQEP